MCLQPVTSLQSLPKVVACDSTPKPRYRSVHQKWAAGLVQLDSDETWLTVFHRFAGLSAVCPTLETLHSMVSVQDIPLGLSEQLLAYLILRL